MAPGDSCPSLSHCGERLLSLDGKVITYRKRATGGDGDSDSDDELHVITQFANTPTSYPLLATSCEALPDYVF